MKTNDKQILELKKLVENKKKLLKSTERFSPKTNCALRLYGENYNLNVLDKPIILRLLASIQSMKLALNSLSIEETLEISGYSVDLWIDDLKSRYSVLNRHLEESRLKHLEEKLHNLLSTDTKITLEIDEIKNQI